MKLNKITRYQIAPGDKLKDNGGIYVINEINEYINCYGIKSAKVVLIHTGTGKTLKDINLSECYGMEIIKAE